MSKITKTLFLITGLLAMTVVLWALIGIGDYEARNISEYETKETLIEESVEKEIPKKKAAKLKEKLAEQSKQQENQREAKEPEVIRIEDAVKIEDPENEVEDLPVNNPEQFNQPEITVQPEEPAKIVIPKKAVVEDRFSTIDFHARNATFDVEYDLNKLASYLARPTMNDIEKARAIYVWLTDNIEYDDEAYNSGDLSNADYKPASVLRSRKAVCGGYSQLFMALGDRMGLEVEQVVGYSKGFGFAPSQRVKQPDHAWNAVLIDGKWRIMDATWGAGSGESVNGRLTTKKEFSDYWFDVDPYESIFNHYPEKSQYALVEPFLSLSDYLKLPALSASFFEIGFDAREIFRALRTNPKMKLPQSFYVGTPIRIVDMPLIGELEAGRNYRFEIFAPKASSVALVDDSGAWHSFKGTNQVFSTIFKPEQRGSLHILIQHDQSKPDEYSGMLTYQIVKARRAG